MTVVSVGQDGHPADNRASSALSGIPDKKPTTAEKCAEVPRQSRATAVIAASTKLPVTCPVNVLARTNPAASPYPPMRANPKVSHLSGGWISELIESLAVLARR